VAIGFAPHAFVAWRETGSPFVNENWRSIVLKHGGFDGQLIAEPGFPGPLAFLREHGPEVLRMGLDDLAHQVSGGLGALLAGGRESLLSAACGLLVLAALLGLVVRRTRLGTLVATCFFVHWVLVCFTFSNLERILLPIVPVAAIALAAMTSAPPRWWSLTCAGGLLVVGALVIAAMPGRLAEFDDCHPSVEVEAARALAARPDVEFLSSTWTHMRLYVPLVAAWLPDFRPQERDAGDPVAWLRTEMARTRASGFVIGRRTAPSLHRRALAATFPTDFDVVRADGDVVMIVLQARFPDGGAAGQWFDAVDATPNPWSAGPITIRATLRTDADVAQLAQVDVRLEPPEQQRGPLLALRRAGERQWSVQWNVPPPPGTWFLRFHVRLVDGRCVVGPRVPLLVR
jgi:hypothetical protein